MKICILGASGFIGRNLISRLLKDTDHQVVAFSRSANSIAISSPRLQTIAGSIFDIGSLTDALDSCDAVVYLFHMMGSQTEDYASGESRAARTYVTAARQAGIKRTVFLGGLGDPTDPALSKHLASRQQTGRILRSSLDSVIELQASMVVGEGSVGFDIIRTMAAKLPFIPIPRWAITNTQPIMPDDACNYILAALLLKGTANHIVGIGGPEVLTYRDLAIRYARQTARQRGWNRRQAVITIPGIPRWAAVWWLEHFASKKSAGIGGPMVESLRNEMVVTNNKAGQLFPAVRPRIVSFE